MTSEWCTIESDPGVFTELIKQMGVKGVQVEELYETSDETLEQMSPVYGLIFLFKYKGAKPKADKVIDPNLCPKLFFAHQVISNACATQAIISVLLNCGEISLGKTLSEFKSFTESLPPAMKGLALSNSKEIRTAHNSFSRPEPFQIESSKASGDDDAYHFVAYLPHEGSLYELDGLQAGPIRHGPIGDGGWLKTARTVVQARMETYQKEGKGEIRFNLLAILRNLQERYSEEIDLLIARKLEAESNAMEEDSPSPDDEDSKAIAEIEAKIEELKQKSLQEEEKFKRWRVENIRRKHNYIPFIFNLLKVLAMKEQLAPLIVAAEKKKKEAKAESDA